MGSEKQHPNYIRIYGHWRAVLTGPDGDIKAIREGENVITTNGKERLAQYLHSAYTGASNPFHFIAIGTDSTAESAANTALGVEVSRHTGSVSYTSGAIYEVVATFATGSGTGAIAEYGLFDQNSGGTMFSRDTEAVINKGANDTLTVTAQVTLS